MGHVVPLLGDLPIATLMRIRREDRDTFARYQYAMRNLLNEMVPKKQRISKREVLELFRDKVVPELLRMKSELRQQRKRQTQRVVGGIASLAASVGLGAFGFLPIAAKVAAVGASAMVGGRLLSKAAEEVCEHGANLVVKNDFYFLLSCGRSWDGIEELGSRRLENGYECNGDFSPTFQDYDCKIGAFSRSSVRGG